MGASGGLNIVEIRSRDIRVPVIGCNQTILLSCSGSLNWTFSPGV